MKHNFNHLFYFWSVANSGSIKDAAEKLCIAPSTICDQIKVLENRLNNPLFSKMGKAFQLTNHGQVLYQLVDGFFSTFENEADQIFNRSSKKQTISIGVSSTVSAVIVGEIIKKLAETSNCSININQLNTTDLLSNTIDKNTEVIISDTDHAPITSTFKFQRFCVRKFCLVSNQQLETSKQQGLLHLNGNELVSYTHGHILHKKTVLFLKKNHLSLPINFQTNSLSLMKQLTLDGSGISILPYLFVKEEINQKKLFSVLNINDFSPEIFVGFSQKSFDSSFIDFAFKKIKNIQYA